MSKAPRRAVAKRPESHAPRTVEVALTAEFDGWVATCRVDFPLKTWSDLNSSDVDRVLAALDRIVVDHNFPDSSGELAASIGEVDPPDAVHLLVKGLSEEAGRLPPR